MGLTMLPTCIIVEPIQGLQDANLDYLCKDTPLMKPSSPDERKECLRAYQARLGVLNDIFEPDISSIDWTPEAIEGHVFKIKDGTPMIHFKVHWRDGSRAWVRMDVLRLQDPFLVIRYGMRNSLTKKPGWEWVEPFMDSDEITTRMLRAHKSAVQAPIKFGVRVPKSNKASFPI